MTWKEWAMRDYGRYWYAVLCLAVLVFGVGEVLRIQADPTAPLTLLLWGLLVVAVLGAEVLVYLLLWKRDHPASQRVLDALDALRRG